MICDAHIHVGQLHEGYYTPNEVLSFLQSVGVEYFAVSSTTICVEDYTKVLSELHTLINDGKDAIVSILWVTPSMLSNDGLNQFINSDIDWKCIKVHGYLHDWHTNPCLLQQIVDLARRMGLPILFHTGGRTESDAGSYYDIIKENNDVRFILAHSRPIEQTLPILRDCSNAYADTAFTPIECVKQMIDEGFEDRVLFGTDYPLPNVFYPDVPPTDYYANVVNSMRATMSPSAWEKVSHKNFEKIFL